MGRPITWQNLQQSSFADASRALTQAQGSFTSGLQNVQDILNKQEATAEANWKQMKDNNTQAFLDEISKYRTPEEYQAAVASGALDAKRQQFGTQIDQSAVRAAQDGRLALLQDRTLKANQYADQTQERDARPIVDQLSMMSMSEDKDVRRSAKEALGIYTQHGMVPKAAELAGKIRTVDHENAAWTREGVKFDREGKKLDSDLLTAAAQRNLLGAQAAHYQADTKRMNTPKTGSDGKFSSAALDEMVKGTNFSSGMLDTKEGRDAFFKGLKEFNLSPKQLDDVLQNFNDLAATGVVGKDKEGKTVRMPLPVEAALQAVGRSTDPTYYLPLVSMRGNNAVDHYKKYLGDNVETLVREYNAIEQARNNLVYPSLVSDITRGAKADKVLEAARSGTEIPLPSVPDRATTRRSIFQGVTPAQDSAEGGALVRQAIQARAEKAKSMMTPQEIEEAKTGKIPFRIKKFLEEGNAR